jgi:hypothetical protein
MYQTLIWSAVLRDEASRLGTPFDAEDLERLADALIDGVRRNFELGRDFLGRPMLIDKAKAVELAGSQPFDPTRDIRSGCKAVWPPIAVRQAVLIPQSDSRPAQHVT